MATDICRRVSSRPERSGRGRVWLRSCALLLLLLLPGFGTGGLVLTVDRLEHPALSFEGLSADFSSESRPSIRFERLRVGEQRWRRVELHCDAGGLSGARLWCRDGRLTAGARVLLPGRIDLQADLLGQHVALAIRLPDGGRIELGLNDARLEAQVEALALGHLAALLPGLQGWSPAGSLGGRLSWPLGEEAVFTGQLVDGAFTSADGLQAGEALAVDLSLSLNERAGGWHWRAELDWHNGAVYVDPVYVEARLGVSAEGTLSADRLDVVQAVLALEGVEQLALSASIDLAEGRLDRAAVSLVRADLATIGPRWLTPLLAPAAGERLWYAGWVSGGLRFEHGGVQALDAVFDQAGFSLQGADGGSGLAFGPVSGHLPWRQDATVHAALEIEGGRWQKLALGRFALNAEIRPQSLAIDRLRIPLLDGALVLDRLTLQRDDRGWRGRGEAVIEPVSMPLLTEALDLPMMSGVLAASMPGLTVSPGALELDGALVISVFDGYLQLTGLRVLEPFGVASHLHAEIEGRHLDLAQLTETFSFGSITGFIDIDVQGLELVRWRPVAFDARVASSPGNYRRRISQRAVQNIGSLGGVGAVAAIQRSLLGFFETFGYREISFSCVLRADVCTMSGIGAERPGGGFEIVRGGGVPALNVIGYNSRVDWRELLARLQRVIEDNASPEVR